MVLTLQMLFHCLVAFRLHALQQTSFALLDIHGEMSTEVLQGIRLHMCVSWAGSKKPGELVRTGPQTAPKKLPKRN